MFIFGDTKIPLRNQENQETFLKTMIVWNLSMLEIEFYTLEKDGRQNVPMARLMNS